MLGANCGETGPRDYTLPPRQKFHAIRSRGGMSMKVAETHGDT